ncbi:MAG TPA: PAS domain S-box protein [Terracidiphilus sp.]|nr:PAS domain S-box protein [Terracidiphilus sp.]
MRNQAEANLSALIESTEDIIWSVDRDYRLVTFNQAFKRTFEIGFHVTPLQGMLATDLLPPERAAIYPPLFERAFTEGPFRTERSLLDGRTLEMSFNPIIEGNETTGVSVFGKDITERKIAEQALREAESRYRDIYDRALEGMFQTSLEGRSLTANPALAKMLGYDSPEDAVASVTDSANQVWVDPEERAHYLQLIEEHGSVLGFECRYKRKDGSVFWVALSCRKVREPDGRSRYIEGFIEDITERKRAEMALRDSEERYRATFEQAAIGIVHLSFDGRIVRCNQRFANIIGYPLDEVPGMTFQQITVPEQVKESEGVLGELLAGKPGSPSWEKCYLRRDGSETWVRLTSSMQHDGQGQPLHIVTFVADINARKATEKLLARAQEDLHTSEARYRTVFQASLDGISISRLSDERYVDVNERFLEIVGYTREEVIGSRSLALGLWESPRDREPLIAALRSNLQVKDFEARLRKRDGQIVWVLLSVSVIQVQDLSCILCVIRDISDAKAAEESLRKAQEAIRTSEERYRTVFQASLDGIAITHLGDGRYVDVNERFLEIVGFTRSELIGKTSLELEFWENPADRTGMVESLRREASFQDREVRLRKKNGEFAWVLMSVSVIEIESHQCVLSLVRDISVAKAAALQLTEAQKALQSSEKRYRMVFETSLDPISITALSDGAYLDVNRAYVNLLGFELDEVLGNSSKELNVWADPRDRQNLLRTLRQNACCRNIEVRFRKKNGEIIWVLLSASLIEVDGVACMLGIIRDLSDAKAAEDEIRLLAFYDPLTRLPNRRLLLDRLQQTLVVGIRDRRKKALLFVDLDNFKTMNETLGHEAGDILLQEAAQRLVACTSEADTVARLGGDEFVVVLDILSEITEDAADQAGHIAGKMIAAGMVPYLLSGRECHVPFSIGITVFGAQSGSAHDILQQAEIAMYQAKAAGRNAVSFFAPALQAEVNARAAMEEDLREALRAGQFELYYQPEVDSSGLIGAESLIRWNHPVRGLLGPDEFIFIAEETGLILPLGEWALEMACRQIAKWATKPDTAHVNVSVNISARQFRQPEFVDQVLAVLYRTGANPESLCLELTESILVENVEEVIDKMSALKSRGLRFSLDDFGTGYSSLSYLKRLPLDQLKIDRAFVRDILVDVSSGAIAQTIISLSRAMGLSVIAEGVETEPQHAFLSGLGCHTFQGYLFSPPLPLKDFELWRTSTGFRHASA